MIEIMPMASFEPEADAANERYITLSYVAFVRAERAHP